MYNDHGIGAMDSWVSESMDHFLSLCPLQYLHFNYLDSFSFFMLKFLNSSQLKLHLSEVPNYTYTCLLPSYSHNTEIHPSTSHNRKNKIYFMKIFQSVLPTGFSDL